jgi:pyruvate dehydrogenase E1 component alpha subunit
MHIADFGVGMLGANGVVAANIPIAAGAAHAIRLKGEDRIGACLFGDGAINRGPFLEGLNWARVYDLPILFVCEDNGFAATTRTEDLTGGPGPGARAASLGLPIREVDGNDMLAVDSVVAELAAAIRAGAGPQFLLAKTYRLTGHTADDPATYRPAEELAARKARDPLGLVRDMLRSSGLGEAILENDQSATEEMAAAVEAAEAAAWPNPDSAFTDVQDIGAWQGARADG